jgi:hypothetical protein
MAITISLIASIRAGASIAEDYYNWTATGSGDTLSFTVTGRLYSVSFKDANGNAISTPPTMGTVAAGTTPGTTTGTITANSGGVVTNGTMIVSHGGL